MKPSATRALEIERMYSEAREALSLAVLRTGALKREVLGGESGQELLAIGRVRHLANVPTPTDEIGASSTLAGRDRHACRSGPLDGGRSARFVR
jgi:hypothetical protein